MALYSLTSPLWLKWLYGRGFLWEVKTTEKEVYLTFDDGPLPGITDWVLDLLKEYQAKATFFCVGDNVNRNPGLYQRILNEGHITGNHTFHHLNGLQTTPTEYLDNVELCAEKVKSTLFRPPYGKMKLRQARAIRKRYTPVMWSVLSADFDVTVSPEQCYKNVITHTKPGAIIVFHDSIKAEDRLRYTLPRYLEYLRENGYVCRLIN